MGLWSWAKGLFPTSGLGQTLVQGVRRNVDPPQRGTQEFLETYEATPWVRAVAGKVAWEIGQTEWSLGRADLPDAEVPDSHIMLRSLRKPNSMLSGTALLRVTQLSLDLVGDAFWMIVRNGLGVPVEFWPIPAHWIAETPSPSEPTYRISWLSWQARIPQTEMLWLHDPMPADPYRRGSGIVRAMGDEVATDEYAAKHSKALFWNRAMPDFVVMDEGASGDELLVHERKWTQKLQGFWKAMSPFFTNRKLEFWQPTQMNLENLTLVPLRQFERDIQLQCWGMPPEQLGIIENSNRATIDASDFVFHSRLIKPRRQFLADELTHRLAVQYDERLVLKFADTTPVDKEFHLNVARTAPHLNTVDEWRKLLLGAPPLDGGKGEVYVLSLANYATPDLADPKARPNNPTGAGRPPKEEEPEKTIRGVK